MNITNTQPSPIRSFQPVISAESRILILGSIPGAASLRAREYYAHPRNAFWPILYTLWPDTDRVDAVDEIDTTKKSICPLPPYEKRLTFLLSKHLALWDVIAACTRTGSLDSSVRGEEIQAFDSFFAAYPCLSKILFNGRKAYDLFSRHHGFADGKTYRLMPSTSPAHASMSFAQKLAVWQKALMP